MDLAAVRSIDWIISCRCDFINRTTPAGCPHHFTAGANRYGNTGLPSPTKAPEPILVQIGGAVQSPGTYTLASNARLEDLITEAGGMSLGADRDRINLTLKLQDGGYYYLPNPGEDIPATAANAPGYLAGADNGGFTYPLNLNTATQEELESLPGIGPSKATDILAYREANGPFATLEDLANVTGIGESTVESLSDYLFVEQP